MTNKNPCPKCGTEMEPVAIPEIGTPKVGVCPIHGQTHVEWEEE